MSSRFGVAFGAILAFVLLALYCSSALHLVYLVYLVGPDGTVTKEDGYIYVLTTVGGLVSALVIAQLSVTKPGSAPTIGGAKPESTVGIYATNTVVAIYLLAWIFTGLAALVVGVMLCPKVNKTISDLGTTWLGLAVSAAYAYFGIQPSGGSEEKQEDELQPRPTINAQLQQKIDEQKITFEAGKPRLREQLLRTNSGPVITPKLQSLVLTLATLSPDPIQISEFPQATDDPDAGRAVTIGNEDIAGRLLPLVANPEQVAKLDIGKIIFDASVAGQSDRNMWNYSSGTQHSYDLATLGAHRTDIYFSVAA